MNESLSEANQSIREPIRRYFSHWLAPIPGGGLMGRASADDSVLRMSCSLRWKPGRLR
jgi:hypothetical protein